MSHFRVIEHIVPAQHIRESPNATEAGAALRLAVKQYVPKDNSSPRAGDVTIIGAHANGFPKASVSPDSYLYERKLTPGTGRSCMSPCGMMSTNIFPNLEHGFEVSG